MVLENCCRLSSLFSLRYDEKYVPFMDFVLLCNKSTPLPSVAAVSDNLFFAEGRGGSAMRVKEIKKSSI